MASRRVAMKTSTAHASRFSAKMAHASSDNESDAESDAAQFISREAEEASESESEDGDERDDSNDSDSDSSSSAPRRKTDRTTKRRQSDSASEGSDGGRFIKKENSDDDDDGDDDDDDENSDDDDDDDDGLPPMKLFSSQPVNPTVPPLSQTPVPLPSTAMARLGGAPSTSASKTATKDSGIKSSPDDADSTSDDADSNSSSDEDASDDSSSDDAEEADEEAGEEANEYVKQEAGADDDDALESARAAEPAIEAESNNGNDSSSEDEDGQENTSAVAADVAAEAAPEAAPDVETVDDAANTSIDSSDDGLDEIPFTLPPGTQSDIADTIEESADADAGAVEAEQPSEEARASPYDMEGLPATPAARPTSAARVRASAAPSSQEMPPSSSQLASQRPKSARTQKAKVPFVKSKAVAGTAEPVPEATESAEPMEVDSGEPVEAAEPSESVPEPQEALPETTSESSKKRKRDTVEEVLEQDDGPATPAQGTANKAAKKSAHMTAGSTNGASASTASAAEQEPSTSTPKTPKAPRTPKARASNGGGASTAGSLKKGPQGNFTPQEVEEMKRVAQQYMADNDMRLGDFNAMVHDNATKHMDFWKLMADEFPGHKRLQVILRLRRVYHNFAHTYNWTAEHDTELAELVGKYGNKWQLIGGLMDRSAEDVRKRWDEHVVCGDKVQMSYWRFDEEKQLARVVGDVLKEIQAARGDDTAVTDTPQEDAINDLPWQIICERMGFTRTARQCRIKWRIIHQSYHFDAAGALVGPPEPEHLTQSQLKAEKLKGMVWSTVQSPAPALAATAPRSVQSLLAKRSESATPRAKTKAEPKSKSKPKSKSEAASKGESFGKSTVIPLLGITPDENGRTVPETDRPISDKARQQVRAMTTADKHTLVLSIRDSNVGREDMIPWPRITDAAFRKTYSRAARELVWSRLKRSVPNYHRKSVRQICDHLMAAYDADESVWDAELDEVETGINGNGNDNGSSNGTTYVAESEDDEGVDASENKSERPHARAARKRVNGAEKQVPESEESGDEEDEAPKEQEQDDIEDASDAEADADAKARSTREPSVDLSMGDGLAADGAADAPADDDHRLTDDMFPLTLSLSPGLAQHKPMALARMLATTDGQPLSAAKPAAKRFGTVASADTPSPLAKQRNANGAIRRTKKRSLGSAQWHADVDTANGSGSSVYDDIEDVSDDARRSQPAKRIRQDQKRAY